MVRTRAEDTAHIGGEASLPILVVRKDTAATTAGSDDDYCHLISDANGKLYVNSTVSSATLAAPSDGTYIGDIKFGESLPTGSNTIGKLAANSGVDIGDVDVTSLPSLPAGSATIGKLAANSGVDIGDVDVTSLPASTNTLEVVGDVAEAATAAGNPILIGGKAKNTDGTDPGEVAENQAVALRTDLQGRLMTTSMPGYAYTETTSIAEAGGAWTNNELVPAQSNFKFYITDVVISTQSGFHATTGIVDIQDTSTSKLKVHIPPNGYSTSFHFAQPIMCAESSVVQADGAGNMVCEIMVNGYYGT